MNVRQSIMAALKTRLQTILTTGGYNTNLGTSVEEWRGYPTDISDHPMLIIRDTEDRVTCDYAVHEHELDAELLIVSSGSTVVAEMRKMIADVYDCLGADRSIGGYITDVIYKGDTLEMLHEEQKLMAGLITITLRFQTGPFDSDKIYNV